MNPRPTTVQERFTELVEPCRDRLWTFLLRLTGDRTRAEDLYQETLLRAWRALHGYREGGRFLSWLFRIGHNVVRDDRRRRAVRPTLISPPNLPEPADPALADDRLKLGERRRRVSDRLGLLSHEQREVFLLRIHSDLRFREIADLTGAPLSTVINRMRDALEKMADIMEDD